MWAVEAGVELGDVQKSPFELRDNKQRRLWDDSPRGGAQVRLFNQIRKAGKDDPAGLQKALVSFWNDWAIDNP